MTLSIDQGVIAGKPLGGGPEAGIDEPQWTTRDSQQLYRIDRWGQGYFRVSERGHLLVCPQQEGHCEIDLLRLVDGLRARDLHPPVLIRFTDILEHRIRQLHEAFDRARRDNDYRGSYRAVYPIKVNQQRHVVSEILSYGAKYGMGLEVGSKPELLAIMPIVEDDQTPIICNGFKDAEYIEAVILAAKIGKKIVPVVEKFNELPLIARYANLHDVRPTIGIRVKLTTPGDGRWQLSSGLHSKFGLFTSEIIEAMRFLRQYDLSECVKLLHFHIGSQATNIANVKRAVTELARLYVEMCRNGASLEMLDVGGGLGVDYDGTKRDGPSSVNYSLDEYASNVVFHIKEVCDQTNTKHPTIITESGRALVAHHSVLVVNVLGWNGFDRFEIPDNLPASNGDDRPRPLVNLLDTYQGLSAQNFHEYYHDAQLAWEQINNLFRLGYCDIEHRALAERLYFGCCSRVLQIVRTFDQTPPDFEQLERILSDTYFCNWSVFQSLPDSWALQQLFPILPIHRLSEKPTCRGVLADITCDSDGRVDRFIDTQQPKRVLELHPYTGKDYFLGIFLVGAYQEILGDLHNLFGDTNAVHVRLEGEEFRIEEIIKGDTVREVLHYVQYSADELLRTMRMRIERSLQQDRLTLEEAGRLLRFYESGLEGYTYLK